MGWVEKLTPSAMQAAPKPLCESCAKKAQDKEKAEKVEKVEKAEVEEVMEVDEWGFQMAMDQVTEAACPEDATAVLEALLKSKPCEDFLKAGHWKNKLEELVKEEMSNPEQGSELSGRQLHVGRNWWQTWPKCGAGCWIHQLRQRTARRPGNVHHQKQMSLSQMLPQVQVTNQLVVRQETKRKLKINQQMESKALHPAPVRVTSGSCSKKPDKKPKTRLQLLCR